MTVADTVKTVAEKKRPIYRVIQRRGRTLADGDERYPIGKDGMREQAPSQTTHFAEIGSLLFAPIRPRGRGRFRLVA
jgi:hypothetical protein